MGDKYAKEIARELRLIRKELEKQRKGIPIEIDGIDNQIIMDAIQKEAEKQEQMRR